MLYTARIIACNPSKQLKICELRQQDEVIACQFHLESKCQDRNAFYSNWTNDYLQGHSADMGLPLRRALSSSQSIETKLCGPFRVQLAKQTIKLGSMFETFGEE